ncbi:hypothetical protein LEMLEM_LOCUS22777, partial [Lemmus lemmus]
GDERLWIHSELRKIRFDQGRPPEKSPVTADPVKLDHHRHPSWASFVGSTLHWTFYSFIQPHLHIGASRFGI